MSTKGTTESEPIKKRSFWGWMFPAVFSLISFAGFIVLFGATVYKGTPQNLDGLWNRFVAPQLPATEIFKHVIVIFVISTAILKATAIMSRKL